MYCTLLSNIWNRHSYWHSFSLFACNERGSYFEKANANARIQPSLTKTLSQSKPIHVYTRSCSHEHTFVPVNWVWMPLSAAHQKAVSLCLSCFICFSQHKCMDGVLLLSRWHENAVRSVTICTSTLLRIPHQNQESKIAGRILSPHMLFIPLQCL